MVAIERNDERGRFEMIVDGHIAFIRFTDDGETLDLTHTEVPEALQGRGVGSKLVREVIAYAREGSRHVKATCPFVREYLERHPEEGDLVP